MGRIFLIASQLLATILFIINFEKAQEGSWLALLIPMILIILSASNSFWFTRAVSWIIFAISFFAFLTLLSAFTLGWRLEPEFSASPYYRSIIMYVAFIYSSLAQIKILGKTATSNKETPNEQK